MEIIALKIVNLVTHLKVGAVIELDEYSKDIQSRIKRLNHKINNKTWNNLLNRVLS